MCTLIRSASAMAGVLVLAAAARGGQPAPAPVGELQVQPASLVLVHPRRPHSILVNGKSADGRSLDLTARATFRSSNEKVVTVSGPGSVQPVGAGDAEVTVNAAGKSAVVKVTV